MTEPPKPTGGALPHAEPAPDGVIDPRTVDAMDRHVAHRLRELHAEVAHLKRSRDGWKRRAETLGEELAWTHDRVARLGRPFRVWLTVRRVLLHPRSVIRLPADLGRALTAPLDPIVIPPRPVPPEAVRAEARARAQAVAVERWLRRPAPMALAGLRVAIIADAPLLEALEPECRLVRLRPDRWRQQVDVERPDIVVVGAAWDGNDGAWRYRVATHAHRLSIGLRDLTAVTAWAESAGVPTVFWNTEDPVRTDRFLEAAGLFDWIVTVDPASAEAYRSQAARRAVGVEVLGPAVQPRTALIRASVSVDPGAGALLASAGEPSWRLDRREAMARLAAAADGVPLAALDRKLGTMPRADLPPTIREARRTGGLDVAPIAYARHPVVLAPSASAQVLPFAALEALACGTPVVMTAHAQASQLAGVAVCDDDPVVLRDAVRRLAADAAAREAAGRDGLRRAVEVGTWRERLAVVASLAGIPVDAGAPRIALALVTGDRVNPDRVVEAVASQERRPDQIVLAAADWAAGRSVQERLERAVPGVAATLVELRPDLEPAAISRRLAAAAEAPWILPLDPERHSDPGLVGREAAHLETGRPAPGSRLSARGAALDGGLVDAPWVAWT